jgi:hypothetical protein
MVHWNRRLALLTSLVIASGLLAAVGAGIHWAMAMFVG